MDMKMIIFRPSVDKIYIGKDLLEAFENRRLIDKTVCEDRIVYIFSDEVQTNIPNKA